MATLKLLAYYLLMAVSTLLILAVFAGCILIEAHGRDRYADVVWIPVVVVVAFLIRIIEWCIEKIVDRASALPDIAPAEPQVRPVPPTRS